MIHIFSFLLPSQALKGRVPDRWLGISFEIRQGWDAQRSSGCMRHFQGDAVILRHKGIDFVFCPSLPSTPQESPQQIWVLFCVSPTYASGCPLACALSNEHYHD